mmetsp:Transcript_11566/g.16015  ORF Transcript_11566/g.16015 Transcript_11566/m.16015 type:complete len:88 (+) Transcript_11566:862-1125(+)
MVVHGVPENLADDKNNRQENQGNKGGLQTVSGENCATNILFSIQVLPWKKYACLDSIKTIIWSILVGILFSLDLCKLRLTLCILSIV